MPRTFGLWLHHFANRIFLLHPNHPQTYSTAANLIIISLFFPVYLSISLSLAICRRWMVDLTDGSMPSIASITEAKPNPKVSPLFHSVRHRVLWGIKEKEMRSRHHLGQRKCWMKNFGFLKAVAFRETSWKMQPTREQHCWCNDCPCMWAGKSDYIFPARRPGMFVSVMVINRKMCPRQFAQLGNIFFSFYVLSWNNVP